MTIKFEAAIYNQQVLDALKEGDHHKNLADDWADTHYFDVFADSMEEAWSKTKRKYRVDHGFIIKAIVQVD